MTLPREAWSPRLPEPSRSIVESTRRVAAGIAALGEPRGFGAMLAGATPAFPLDLAVPRVRALAAAYRADDHEAVRRASRALLGLGGGLTPSGDDLVGGALFGRLLVAPDPSPWRKLGAELAIEAERASHAISAALLADLAAGASFAPLHATAEALARGDDALALESAGVLAALGHSSGWDMLTGLVVGVTGKLNDE